MSPAAKPANPAPSTAMSSTWVEGTSLALGMPLISTKEQRKNSSPSSILRRTSAGTGPGFVPPPLFAPATSRLLRAGAAVAMGPPCVFGRLVRYSGRGLLADEPIFVEPLQRKWAHERRYFPRRDALCRHEPGDRR